MDSVSLDKQTNKKEVADRKKSYFQRDFTYNVIWTSVFLFVPVSKLVLFYFIVIFFLLFRATPAAYGSSEARGWIVAEAELHLQSMLLLVAMLDP